MTTFFFLFNAQLLLMGPRILWQWKEKHINLNLNLSLCHPMVYTLWIISCTDAKNEEWENTRGRFCSCRPIHQQHNLILVCGMKWKPVGAEKCYLFTRIVTMFLALRALILSVVGWPLLTWWVVSNYGLWIVSVLAGRLRSAWSQPLCVKVCDMWKPWGFRYRALSVRLLLKILLIQGEP